MIAGKTIAITMMRGHAESVADMVTKAGGIPYIIPTTELRAVDCGQGVSSLASELYAGRIDYVVFLSANAFTHLARAADAMGIHILGALQRVPTVAIGSQTARFLESNGLRVADVPGDYSSDGLVRLFERIGVSGRSIAVIRNASARDRLAVRLGSLGASRVIELCTYKTEASADDRAAHAFAGSLRNGSIAAIVFGSGLEASCLLSMLHVKPNSGQESRLFRGVRLAAIGKSTAARMSAIGLNADIVPDEHTFEALVRALAARL